MDVDLIKLILERITDEDSEFMGFDPLGVDLNG